MKEVVPVVPVSIYRYHLPETRIPDRPLSNREQSKLLVYKKGEIIDRRFSELADCVQQKPLLIFNNSKVIPARLHFLTPSGAAIEILCLHPVGVVRQEEQHQSQHWQCIVGNLKRWKAEVILSFGANIDLTVELIEKGGEENLVRFSWNKEMSFFDLLERVGEIPLPPYMHRKADVSDKERYQTVYASSPGSVAAPTAGLHFTPSILDQIKERGWSIGQVTLHVGAGTFKPIKSEDVASHTMHEEYFEVDLDLIRQLINNDQVIPVGTTSMRTLESLYHLGCQLQMGNEEMRVSQWSGFAQHSITVQESLGGVLAFMEKKGLPKLIASTSIMIVPGYVFRVCKGLITNFHQPESTLILLVAAFVGEDWKRIYEHALENDYRFLSYGDSSLLLP